VVKTKKGGAPRSPREGEGHLLKSAWRRLCRRTDVPKNGVVSPLLCVEIPTVVDFEPIKAQNQTKIAPRKSGAMTRYRLKTPIAAIYDKVGGSLVRVMVPAGAMLTESSQPSGTVIGMIGVYWEGRHYSIHLRDLLRNGERVSVA
jgi:hypothetical protein